MAARPRKSKPTTEETKSNTFLDALKFVSLVTKEHGPPNETHVLLNNKTATAFNGVLAAGAYIQEDIYAAPHNKTIIEALSKCGEHISITQLDNNRLSIKSNKFKAIVPCLDPVILGNSIPDQPIAIIDDRFKEALESVSGLIVDDDRIVPASILMNGQSIISTTGTVIFEYWHGIDLPSGLPIPKSIIKPLTQCSKKLCKFGFSQSSVTFYYEDNSWLRSQLIAGEWPEFVKNILNRPNNPFPVLGDFWHGLASIQPFTDGLIHFDAGVMRSHASSDVGASYEVAGLPKGPIYPAKQLVLIKPYAEQIDFVCPYDNHYCLYFYGKQIRGIICGIKK